MVDYIHTDTTPPQLAAKDVNDVLDYLFDFTSVLTKYGGDTIKNKTITADDGITFDGSTIVNSNTAVQVWLSGGTVNTDYTVICKATTAAGRVFERSMVLSVSAL